VGDDTRLALVSNLEGLISKEALSVVDIVLQVRNAFVDLSLCLCDRLAHFLGHESSIGVLVFAKNFLQVAQLLKAT